jgi:hypothetical protein
MAPSTPSEKPTILQGDLAHLPAAFAAMMQVRRWVVWNLERDQHGRWTKVPYRGDAWRERASNDNPSTWVAYATALAAYQAGHSDGIGYALMDDDVAAIDLDHCRDPVTGALSPWAHAMIAEAGDTYIEISVSGTGLRIWGIGTGAPVHRTFKIGSNGEGFELYRRAKRFSVVTGNPLNGADSLHVIDHVIDNALLKYDGGTPAEEFAPDEQPQPQTDDPDPGDRLSKKEVEDIIKNGVPVGQRSKAFQRVVWWLAVHHSRAHDIRELLEQHPDGIAKKYQGRLAEEVERSYGKWLDTRRTRAAGHPVAQSGHWPEIECIEGETPRILREAEEAMLKIATLHHYARGDRIVRPSRTRIFNKTEDDAGNRVERESVAWNVVEISEPELFCTMSRAARFLKWDRRASYWRQVDVPRQTVTAYLNQKNWRLPSLAGITTAPFLRADGTLCASQGYDPATGMLLLPSGEEFPPISEKPTLDGAKAALATLRECIKTFPFVSDDDQAVVLSGILSALDRRMLQNIPLHALSSPKQGTGKTMLADIIGMIATGHLPPAFSPGNTTEELDKRFEAAMLTGSGVMLIDNIIRPLESEAISSALTHDEYTVRVLGQSRNVTVPADVLVLATGNNLVLCGDLQRRTIEARIDPGVEYPEQRHFDFNPLIRARKRRRELIAAALTLQRAFFISGNRIAVTPMGSFEIWSERVREPLIWAGAGDPQATNAAVKQHDTEALAFDRIVLGWQTQIGLDQPVTTKEIVAYSANLPAFWDALLEVARTRKGDTIDPLLLGRWLAKHRDRVSNGIKLMQIGEDRNKVVLWVLKRIQS